MFAELDGTVQYLKVRRETLTGSITFRTELTALSILAQELVKSKTLKDIVVDATVVLHINDNGQLKLSIAI